MTSARPPWHSRFQDGPRSRTIILNQLLLAGVLLFAGLLVIVIGPLIRPTLLIAGVGVAFAATAIALLVPWERLPILASAIVPLLDMAAIGILREASPAAGFGLLWAFPAMWSAWAFGTLGAVVSVSLVTVAYTSLNIVGASSPTTVASVLFPTTIAAVATISLMSSRRAHAQRDLLEQQSLALQRAVERARRQEDLVTDVLDTVDFGVISFTPDGQTSISNHAHARLQEIRDRAGDAIYAEDGTTRIPPEATPLARARRGETFSAQLVWYGEPGEDRRALNAAARRIRDSRGREAGTIFVARDATVEQQALREREDLIASVSHELRTPLTSILGYIELACDDTEVSPATRRNLEIAQRNAGRLLHLVSDVLIASTTSRRGSEIAIHIELTDLADVARAAIESATPRAQERGMRIDGSGIDPTPIRVDPHRIRQVIDNLISNAIKYGHEGGRIDVGCTRDDGHAWIVVRDDGPGIPAQEQPRIFDRFFRSDAVRHTSIHGSGLGLAISRDIVHAHGGDLTVQSDPGQGSTFIVRVPAPTRKDSA